MRAFFTALFALFKIGVFAVHGEEERPYCVGAFDSTLTWNKKTHIGGALHFVWLALMEIVLFFIVAWESRKYPKWIFHVYRASTLVAGRTFDTGLMPSVYGYMLVDGDKAGQIVSECYMDVSDAVVLEDLKAHRDYDFSAEAASYDKGRGVFMVFNNETLPNLLDWVETNTSENSFVTFLRNIDT